MGIAGTVGFSILVAPKFSKSHMGLYCTIPLINPFTPKSDFIDLTLSNVRRFYSSKGDPLGVKGLMLIAATKIPAIFEIIPHSLLTNNYFLRTRLV